MLENGIKTAGAARIIYFHYKKKKMNKSNAKKKIV